jgi:hypothetical protein
MSSAGIDVRLKQILTRSYQPIRLVLKPGDLIDSVYWQRHEDCLQADVERLDHVDFKFFFPHVFYC